MDLVLIRGGGEIASAIACKLNNSGFQVVMLEEERPTAIRRTVAFSEAVYMGKFTIENVTCRTTDYIDEVHEILTDGDVAMMVDESGRYIPVIRPFVIVDTLLKPANKIDRSMAPVTIAISKEYEAGVEVDAIVESQRGHNLGKITYFGSLRTIEDISPEISIFSPADGIIKAFASISDYVSKDDIIAFVEAGDGTIPIYAPVDGVLTGLYKDDIEVCEGSKIAKIDCNMDDRMDCFTISDRARSVAGGVLEAILYLRNHSENEI